MLQGETVGLIKDFLTWKGGIVPNFDDSFLFLVSEVGELADAVVANREQWARNDLRKIRSIRKEIADVFMMLLLTADAGGINLQDELREMMRSKGFFDKETNA